jgi:hypothetical protein
MIAERCMGFAQLVEEKEVGVEEVAGWAAGWGDWVWCVASSEEVRSAHGRTCGGKNRVINDFTSAKGSVAALNVVLLVL